MFDLTVRFPINKFALASDNVQGGYSQAFLWKIFCTITFLENCHSKNILGNYLEYFF